MKHNFIWIALALSIFINLFFYIWKNQEIYTTPFNPQEATNRYFNSAYIKGDKADYILSDAELYTIEGYFLVNGEKTLTELTPGHPPLGKYLTGLSIKLFNNQFIFSLFASLTVIFLVYSVSKQFLRNKTLALLVASLFSLESLFLSQLHVTLLDNYFLAFTLLSVYFYLRWNKSSSTRHLLLSQFFLGLSMATKFFPAGIPLLVALYATTLFTGNFKKFTRHTWSLGFIVLGFVAGFFVYFIQNPSIIDFIRYQRFVVSWWAGSPSVPPLQVWDMIFFNRWHTWWGQGVIAAPNWNISWPILISLSLLSYPVLRTKKLLPLYLWVVFSLLMFSFSATYPRHLLTILPALYILSLKAIQGRILSCTPNFKK